MRPSTFKNGGLSRALESREVEELAGTNGQWAETHTSGVSPRGAMFSPHGNCVRGSSRSSVALPEAGSSWPLCLSVPLYDHSTGCASAREEALAANRLLWSVGGQWVCTKLESPGDPSCSRTLYLQRPGVGLSGPV